MKTMKGYGVTTKGNGDAFISEERHTTLSIGGGEPGQGFPCVLVIENEETSVAVRSDASDE